MPCEKFGQQRCDLGHYAGTVMVRSRGPDHPSILVVGEAPGREEDRAGYAFVGKSGQKFEELLVASKIDPAQVRYTNICRCVPWLDNNKRWEVRPPTPVEAKACLEYLYYEILTCAPLIIMPLGGTASQYLTGVSTISRSTGRVFEFEVPDQHARKLLLWIWECVNKRVEPWASKSSEILDVASAQQFIEQHWAELPPEVQVWIGETQKFTTIPTYHPAAIYYGNKDAEQSILQALSSVKSVLSGEPLIKSNGYIWLDTLDKINDYVNLVLARHERGEQEFIAVDVETTSLDIYTPTERLLCWSISHEEGQAALVPYQLSKGPFANDALAQGAIRQMMNRLFEKVPVANQNIKFDYEWFLSRGMEIKHIFFDTMLAAWWLYTDQIPHDLEFLASRYAGMVAHKQEMHDALKAATTYRKEGRRRVQIPATMDDIDLEILRKYNGADSDAALRLTKIFRKQIIDKGDLSSFDMLMTNQIKIAAELEMNGVRIDPEKLKQVDADMNKEIEGIYQWFKEMGYSDAVMAARNTKEFSLGSADDLRVLLVQVLGFRLTIKTEPSKRFPQGQLSTATYVLEGLSKTCKDMAMMYPDRKAEFARQSEAVDKILEFKKIYKVFSAYVKPLPSLIKPDGRVHPSYTVGGTATGRWTCTEPSLHTMPWRSPVKRSFISRFEHGVLLHADYSQLELRVAAILTGDEALVDAFRTGKDIHRVTAAKIFNLPPEEVKDAQRRQAKTVSFGLLYGRGAKAIAEDNQIPLEQAQSIIDAFFNEMKAVKKWIDEQHAYVQRNKKTTNKLGRTRHIIEWVMEDDPGHIDRVAVNTPVQGLASDITSLSLYRFVNRIHTLGMRTRVFGFIHDAMEMDVYPGELSTVADLVYREMTLMPPRLFPWITVPLECEIEVGANWGNMCGLKLKPGGFVLKGEPDTVADVYGELSCWDPAPVMLSCEIPKDAEGKPILKDGKEVCVMELVYGGEVASRSA